MCFFFVFLPLFVCRTLLLYSVAAFYCEFDISLRKINTYYFQCNVIKYFSAFLDSQRVDLTYVDSMEAYSTMNHRIYSRNEIWQKKNLKNRLIFVFVCTFTAAHISPANIIENITNFDCFHFIQFSVVLHSSQSIWKVWIVLLVIFHWFRIRPRRNEYCEKISDGFMLRMKTVMKTVFSLFILFRKNEMLFYFISFFFCKFDLFWAQECHCEWRKIVNGKCEKR